jgi:hypothetical protein
MQGNGLPRQAVRVPFPVEPFVMLGHDGDDLLEVRDRFENLRPLGGMSSDNGELLLRQPPRLVEDRGRNTDLPDVVEQPAAVQLVDFVRGQPQFPAEVHGQVGHPFGVARRPG